MPSVTSVPIAYLDAIDIRSAEWSMDNDGASPRSNRRGGCNATIHIVLEGVLTLVGADGAIVLGRGDLVIRLPAESDIPPASRVEEGDARREGVVHAGSSERPARILRGDLIISWPQGGCSELRERDLVVRKSQNPIAFEKVAERAVGPGAEALLRRAAEAALIAAVASLFAPSRPPHRPRPAGPAACSCSSSEPIWKDDVGRAITPPSPSCTYPFKQTRRRTCRRPTDR